MITPEAPKKKKKKKKKAKQDVVPKPVVKEKPEAAVTAKIRGITRRKGVALGQRIGYAQVQHPLFQPGIVGAAQRKNERPDRTVRIGPVTFGLL